MKIVYLLLLFPLVFFLTGCDTAHKSLPNPDENSGSAEDLNANELEEELEDLDELDDFDDIDKEMEDLEDQIEDLDI